MDETDRARILARYADRMAKFGPSSEVIASGSAVRHRLRHQVLREVGIADHSSVLDVGCGFGDFLGYLESVDTAVAYTGVDINGVLLEEARARHPQARFLEGEIFSVDEKFDFVVSSAAFNLRLEREDNYDYLGKVMTRALDIADQGVAIDLLTTYTTYPPDDDSIFCYQPERVFGMAKQLTKRVSLRHDYPLFDFCVYLYPDFDGWSK